MTAPTTTPSAVPPEDGPTRCARCEAEVDGSLRETSSDRAVCSDCVETCEDCGSIVTTDEIATTTDDRRSCDDCRWTCEDCGADFSENATQYTNASDDSICSHCREDHYCYCESCEDLIHTDAIFVSSYDDGYRCGYCHDRHYDERSAEDDEAREDMGPIAEYHHAGRFLSPIPSPASKAAGGLYFGVELEVERASNARRSRGELAEAIAAEVRASAGRITEGRRGSLCTQLLAFERDGSLCDGFEMITAPMGIDDQRRLWSQLLPHEAFRELRSHNTETCGLHVHVSRAALTTTQIAKLVTFTNDPDNAALIVAVARRYDGGFCHVKTKRLAVAHRPDDDRYQAVNLWNAKTIEFRIFKGSTKVDAVLAALEFVGALVEFCAPCSAVGFNLKTAPFLDFIASNAMRKHTRHLRAYLDQRLPQNMSRPNNFTTTRKETAPCAS
jgi:hypothetical protein